MKRRILCALTALALCLALLPGEAWAVEDSEISLLGTVLVNGKFYTVGDDGTVTQEDAEPGSEPYLQFTASGMKLTVHGQLALTATETAPVIEVGSNVQSVSITGDSGSSLTLSSNGTHPAISASIILGLDGGVDLTIAGDENQISRLSSSYNYTGNIEIKATISTEMEVSAAGSVAVVLAAAPTGAVKITATGDVALTNNNGPLFDTNSGAINITGKSVTLTSNSASEPTVPNRTTAPTITATDGDVTIRNTAENGKTKPDEFTGVITGNRVIENESTNATITADKTLELKEQEKISNIYVPTTTTEMVKCTIESGKNAEIGTIHGNGTGGSLITFKGGPLTIGEVNLWGNVNSGIILNDNASVTVTGTLGIGGDGKNGGVITVADGASLTLNASEGIQNAGNVTINGNGTITLNNRQLTISKQLVIEQEAGRLIIQNNDGKAALLAPENGAGNVDDANKNAFKAAVQPYLVGTGYIIGDCKTCTDGKCYAVLDQDGKHASSLTLKGPGKTASNYYYTIIARAEANGSVTGGGTYAKDDSVTVTARPSYGYEFDKWMENGTEVSAPQSYTFGATADRTLTAHFKKTVTPPTPTSYTINVKAEPSEGGTVTGHGSYKAGASATVTAVANDGYEFVNWTENGAQVSADVSYQFTVNGPRTLTAHFKKSELPPPEKQDVSLKLTAEPAELNGGGVVTLTVTGLPENGEATLSCDDETLELVKGEGHTWSVQLPNEDKEYTFTARFAGNQDYNPAQARCTVTVTARSVQPEPPVRPGWPVYPSTPEEPEDTTPSRPQEPPEEPEPPKICDGGEDCPSRAFRDLDPELWYHHYVDFVLVKNIMGGFEDGSFRPDERLSRAMLAQILYNRAGRPEVPAGSRFPDVDPKAWYAPAVNWAHSKGLVDGFEDGSFRPDQPVSREQMAVILWRCVGRPQAVSTELPFSDAGEISPWALDALRWFVEQRIMGGKGNGLLDPKGFATRAEAAKILKLLFDQP